MNNRLVLGAIVVPLVLGLGAFVYIVADDQADQRSDTADTAERNERRVTRVEKRVLPIQRVLVEKGILRQGERGLIGGPGPRGRPGRSVMGPAGRSVVGPQGPPGETVVGPQGEPGTSVTLARIMDAVRDYCEAHDECRGSPGTDGATGAQGPGPTDEQIAAAVAAYLSSHTLTCEPTSDPFDPPGRQTCTVDA